MDWTGNCAAEPRCLRVQQQVNWFQDHQRMDGRQGIHEIVPFDSVRAIHMSNLIKRLDPRPGA